MSLRTLDQEFIRSDSFAAFAALGAFDMAAIKQVERRLTNAEIKTLFTAPITLVPAKAGTIFVPLFATIIGQTTAGVYATVANFFFGAAASIISGTALVTVSLAGSELDTGALTYSFTAMPGLSSSGSDSGLVSAVGSTDLLLTADANPTGGNVLNYAIVTVFYVELPTV